MAKYYKVIKENPLWEVGAILSDVDEPRGYMPIEDVWNKHDILTEYLSSKIVEGSPDFFERVYKSLADKMVYLTKEQFQKAFDKKFVK